MAQLHYDQQLKQEAKQKSRLHKGHPLCNLAIVGRVIGSNSLARHYALLSSAGDVYWEHVQHDLRIGGLGPTLLEQFESTTRQDAWRESTRTQAILADKNKPAYLEAFLAARWFSDSLAQHFFNLAGVEQGGGKPFVDVLLAAVDDPQGVSTTTTGTRFEAAAGLVMSGTPGFEVDSARKTTDEQIDFVVRYTDDPLSQLGFDPGFGLVECKSSASPVSVSELRDFGAKCLFHRVQFGVLVARSGITGDTFAEPQMAELVRRRFQADGVTILVLQGRHLRGKTRLLRGVQDELCADHRFLAFGPIA